MCYSKYAHSICLILNKCNFMGFSQEVNFLAQKIIKKNPSKTSIISFCKVSKCPAAYCQFRFFQHCILLSLMFEIPVKHELYPDLQLERNINCPLIAQVRLSNVVLFNQKKKVYARSKKFSQNLDLNQTYLNDNNFGIIYVCIRFLFYIFNKITR